jgi:hypothetical protein
VDTDIPQSIRARELALELVGKFAPEELDLFDELATAPIPDPKQRRRDDPLAFGVELAGAFTPVAMSLASTAVSFLVGELSNAVVGAGKDEVKSRIRNWLGGKEPVPRRSRCPSQSRARSSTSSSVRESGSASEQSEASQLQMRSSRALA